MTKTYFFRLKAQDTILTDLDGVDLADEHAALAHARAVAGELMRNRERECRSWRIEVLDDTLSVQFELMFASFDGSLGHLAPHLRQSVERACRSFGSLSDVIVDIRTTIDEVRETLRAVDGALASARVAI